MRPSESDRDAPEVRTFQHSEGERHSGQRVAILAAFEGPFRGRHRSHCPIRFMMRKALATDVCARCSLAACDNFVDELLLVVTT
jgi:hypothetical protein